MKIRLLLILSCGLLAIDATAQSSLMEELDQARSLWESRRLGDYAFIISNVCSCPDPIDAGPLLVVVEQGRLRRALYLGESGAGYSPGQSVRKRTPLRVTIPGLFQFMEKRLRRGNSVHFKIKYDTTYGYPTLFEYDDPALKGEEIRLQLKDFKRLE